MFRLKDGVITLPVVPQPNPPPISPQKLSWFEVIVKFGLLKIAIISLAVIGIIIATKLFIEKQKDKTELAIAKQKTREEEEKKRIAIEKENNDWEYAKRLNNKQGYNDYLNKYPQGIYKQYAQSAKDSIDRIRLAEIEKQNKEKLEKEIKEQNKEKLEKEIKEHISTAITYLNGNQIEKAKTEINRTLTIKGLGAKAKDNLKEAFTYMGLPNKNPAIQSLNQAKNNPLN